jgi:hypothetical protein
MKTTHLLGLTIGALLTAAALGGCEQRRDNATLTVEIRDELNRQQLPSTITVAVADGVANLGGTVRDADAREKAEDIAEDVDGVTHVNNNIRVTTAAGDAPAKPGVAPQYDLPESAPPPAGAGNEPAARPGMETAPHAGDPANPR